MPPIQVWHPVDSPTERPRVARPSSLKRRIVCMVVAPAALARAGRMNPVTGIGTADGPDLTVFPESTKDAQSLARVTFTSCYRRSILQCLPSWGYAAVDRPLFSL